MPVVWDQPWGPAAQRFSPSFLQRFQGEGIGLPEASLAAARATQGKVPGWGGLTPRWVEDEGPLAGPGTQGGYTPAMLGSMNRLQRLYAGILGRPGSEAEWGAWQGANPQDAVQGIIQSPEYNIGARNPQQILTDLYEGILGRTPDPTGLAGWLPMLPGSLQDVIQGLLGSPEYAGQGPAAPAPGGGGAPVPTPGPNPYQGFLGGLYTNLLGRAPDEAGLQAWAQTTPHQALQGILGSPEYAARGQAPAQQIGGLYQSLLGRAPEAEGLAGWTSALPNVGLSGVAQGIYNAPEAQQRWGALPGWGAWP